MRVSCGVWLGVGLLLPVTQGAAESGRRSFDVPAGDAVVSLKRFATQSGEQLLYSPDDVSGIRTQAVQGEFVPLAALDRMLERTPLKARQDAATRAIAITSGTPSRAPPASPPETPPAVPSKPFSASTPAETPVKTRSLLTSLATWFAAAGVAEAQVPAPASAPVADSQVVTLNAFTVSASDTSGYRAEKTVSGTLIATDVKSMPASIQVVTAALLADMDTRRVEDSIRFISGVGLAARNEGAGGGTRSEQFVVRGFQTSQVLRNGVRMQGITNSANLERIEVLKGPSSIFFGAADPGGVINVITKRPLAERYGAVRLGFGDDNYKYAEFDFNQPIVDKTLLFRFMGSRLDTDGWRKFWHDNQTFLSAVAEWNPTPTTRLTFDAQVRKQTGIQERLGDVFLTTDRPAPFTQQLLTGAALQRTIELGALTPTDTYDDESTFHSVTLAQKVGERVLVSAVYGASDGNRLQRTTVTRNRIATNDNYSYFDRPGISSIGAVNRTINVNVLVSFDLLRTKNKLVAGWDRSEAGNKELLFAYANNSPFTTKRFLFDRGTDAEIFGVRKYPTLEEIGTPNGPGAVVNNPWSKPIWQQGAYVTNQMKLFDERLTLLGGTRWSDLRAQGRTAWTPQYGATFAITPGISAYALYSESFRPNGRASTIDPTSPFFPPENGVGKEGGLKFSLIKNKLTGTVALFQVDKKNVRRVNSGAAVLGINGATLTDGERSDGYEMDLVWTPTRNFTAILSAAHINARVFADVINTASSPDLNNDGKPDTLGLPLVGNSPDSYALWTKYEFTQAPLAGLALSLGYQRREGPIPLDASFARKFVVQDAYDRLDVVVAYATRVFQRRVRFQLNVNNVTDNFYADRSLGYANPRTWRLSAGTTF
ncbi:TonB-dependent siderophore receptor [Horticoccus sp. 23ND18S-11]|uniref:TonB-dependent siderophore receptor n=1 Tax=Horticoccus sp. 23ND18S-11 TaxID=3391832 RepID=UPI0039C9B2C5